MTRATSRVLPAALLGWLAVAACGSATRAAGAGRPQPASGHQTGAAATPRPFSEADARFMSGMIHHHAQAVLMAGWAPTHQASAAVRRLAERIVVGQEDEIQFMRNWLRERGQPATEDSSAHHVDTGGSKHSMPMMPGMLTSEQLAELDRARGPEFDRLFLTFMIQHHRGAQTMVEQLFATPGAARDDTVFKFASDMHADQTIEIERMSTMLAALPPGGPRQ